MSTITIEIPLWFFWTLVAMWCITMVMSWMLRRADKKLTELYRQRGLTTDHLIDRLIAYIRREPDQGKDIQND